jgi:ribonuclease HII
MKSLANYLEPIDWRSFASSDPHYPIIGVDEVGRGCLAGPVYAAAVSFNSDILSDLVTDSKLLSEKRRDELAIEIKKHHQVGLGFATVEEIDEINILQASLLAMKRAVENLGVTSGHLLIDGNKAIPGMSEKFKQTTIVKGDLRVSLISAASIVAKVTRDQLMKDLSIQFPVYGFEAHKGYSTAIHKKSIADHGPCIWHRRTFSGVKEYLSL